MKTVTRIEYVNEFPLYDISVENEHCFELSNGFSGLRARALWANTFS